MSILILWAVSFSTLSFTQLPLYRQLVYSSVIYLLLGCHLESQGIFPKICFFLHSDLRPVGSYELSYSSQSLSFRRIYSLKASVSLSVWCVQPTSTDLHEIVVQSSSTTRVQLGNLLWLWGLGEIFPIECLCWVTLTLLFYGHIGGIIWGVRS